MKAPSERNASPTRMMIKINVQEAPFDILFTVLRPMAASIQPQIAKRSNVDKSVATTGICFPSIKNDGLACSKPRWLAAKSISSVDFRANTIKFAIIEIIVGGKLEYIQTDRF